MRLSVSALWLWRTTLRWAAWFTFGSRKRRMNRPSDTDLTLRYYDQHAAEFCARTVDVDMSALHAGFLAHIRPGGRILDAGCGSGRDSLAFIQQGYDVVSMDG